MKIAKAVKKSGIEGKLNVVFFLNAEMHLQVKKILESSGPMVKGPYVNSPTPPANVCPGLEWSPLGDCCDYDGQIFRYKRLASVVLERVFSLNLEWNPTTLTNMKVAVHTRHDEGYMIAFQSISDGTTFSVGGIKNGPDHPIGSRAGLHDFGWWRGECANDYLREKEYLKPYASQDKEMLAGLGSHTYYMGEPDRLLIISSSNFIEELKNSEYAHLLQEAVGASRQVYFVDIFNVGSAGYSQGQVQDALLHGYLNKCFGDITKRSEGVYEIS